MTTQTRRIVNIKGINIPYADLAREGYAIVQPAIHKATIDRHLCENGSCPRCGNDEQVYVPFYNPITLSYRAFVWCSGCKYAEEF